MRNNQYCVISILQDIVIIPEKKGAAIKLPETINLMCIFHSNSEGIHTTSMNKHAKIFKNEKLLKG